MASQPESKIPGPSGSGGREKRRSFLPAPKRSSAIPQSNVSASAVVTESETTPVNVQKQSPAEEPVTVEETIPGAEKLTVGSRILIGGVKPGILRFVGKTNLAPGIWCGIELFDASGLHDGEVDGKRYFTCKPFRGIFAPLDKVVVDESHKSLIPEEKSLTVSEDTQEAKEDDKQILETVEKQTATENEDTKVPRSKSQIARLSGIPRIGSASEEKGVVKSKSADGIKEATSKIAVLSKRSSSGQDASKVGLHSTFVLENEPTIKHRKRSEDADADCSLNQTYSLQKQLLSDSRQYFNITFNKDTPPSTNPTSNLPDVVSSASPSPPRETTSKFIPGNLNQTQSAQDIASSIASDISLGLMDPDIIADDTNLLEGLIPDRVAASTSESDISLSGNSSTLEDTSVDTVNEVVAGGLSSTPLQGVDFKKFLDETKDNLPDNHSDADSAGSTSITSVKQNLAQTFTTAAFKEELTQRKDSTSSIGGISAVRADLLQEEGSNGVSPEVSQVLEWDYDHDAFDGKLLLEKCQDGMSTSTSDSCSEASADHGGVLAEKGAHDVDMPLPDGDEAHLFEESEDGFENIDNIDDFPLGMSKTPHMMTDSGISEKGFLDPVADAASKRWSVEFDNKVNVVDLPKEDIFDNTVSAVDLPGEDHLETKVSNVTVPVGVVVERRVMADTNLQKDLMDGHTRQERPLSLVSTTSADTGYVPDTDSEAGTLTTNSPTDWVEKQLNANPANTDPRQRAHVSGKPKQTVTGVPEENAKETEADSDICSDAEPGVVETVSERTLNIDDHEKTACNKEPEESEDEEEGEDEESSEEETASEDEEAKEEEVDDDRPEDDRIEADRIGPSGDTHTATEPVALGNRSVADGNHVTNETFSVNSDMTESTSLPETEIPGTGVTDTTDATGLTAPGSATHGEEGSESKAAPVAKCEVSDGPDQSLHTTNTSGEEASSSCPATKKKLSPVSPVDKKVMAEHKKVVKSAHSRLADYIKTPPPTPKPKDEIKGEPKSKKLNAIGARSNKALAKKQDNSSSNVADKTKGEEKIEKKPVPVKDEKPKVKHAAPKSKWGNIMSQIETSKETIKSKPKTEVKSSLAVYLSSTANTSTKKEAEKDNTAKQREDVSKSKSKLKLVKHSKSDFSNIKSKLSISSPPKQLSNPREKSISSSGSSPKDSDSPKDSGNRKDSPKEVGKPKDSGNPKDAGNPKGYGNPKGSGHPKDSGNLRDSGKISGNVKERGPKTTLAKKVQVSKLKIGKLQTDHVETLDNCSTMSQAASSRTDLSVLDDVEGTVPRPGQSHLERKRNALSCAGPRQKNERSSSVASTKSDTSTAQRSVKSMNLRNAQKHDTAPSNVTSSKKSAVKSSIPPPTPRTKLTPPSGEVGIRSKSSPPKLTTTTTKPKTGGTATSSPSTTNTLPPANRPSTAPNRSSPTPNRPSTSPGANQGRLRSKAGSGLKSGQPPDVVSTSARGSRAQEVARLESLCEARTKELNYTKMQLKAGLQAFDAMACLLNYCTNQLNAFSCPAVTAKLKTAEGKLTEQQEMIECLNQQKAQLDQHVQEMTGAKEAALQDVAKLKQEMAQAEDSHSAAQQQLKEEHAAALKTLEEDLNSQHQKNVQQMQTCHEKHSEYTRQSHKRQVLELNAEHQMFTNQLNLAHLEEIQELRNKHDQQMEELHAQHRNKLEDITRRFESIKHSLSEKVQSLCEECDELRMRAKTSEEALQRDADVKVQLALAPYLHLPKEIESLKMVVDMRTEEIQKLRRHNMDLEKQLEELPIAQEKVASLQQKVENLQAIINIKTDHEKQLHEKCQVLMRKYDRESRANKRLSMDYEQVVWRMSQSADLTGSMESLGARQLSTSPSRSEEHSHTSPSPVRRSHSSMSQGESGTHSPGGVPRRHRKISGGEEGFDRKIRCRSATFSLDKSKTQRSKADTASGINGSNSSPGSPSKQPFSRSGDYADMIVAAMNSENGESISSGLGSWDLSDAQSDMKSSVILETSRGVSYNIDVVDTSSAEPDGGPKGSDEVFMEQPSQTNVNIPQELLVQGTEVEHKSEVTVVVNSPTSD